MLSPPQSHRCLAHRETRTRCRLYGRCNSTYIDIEAVSSANRITAENNIAGGVVGAGGLDGGWSVAGRVEGAGCAAGSGWVVWGCGWMGVGALDMTLVKHTNSH